ncbi:MAG: HD domain-containing protein [Candidatus Peribacteria bacterium]|jgi:uncharacterized protein|nr:HD domain-containing protein [Candidatus Peribacteria bacterium]
MSNIIDQVRTFVENECKKSTSKYGYEPFHFIPMVAYAKQLAYQLGGDKEIIEIAGRLHDIGSIIYGREDHHITGADIAEKKLIEFNYPFEKIALIKKCIFNHRGSKDFIRESIEEQIIAEADVMSSFDNISGLFKAAFVYEHLDQGQAKTSVRQKLERKRNQLHFEASKELIQPKYAAAMLLLKA